MSENQSGLPWYACSGYQQDVIVSTRVRLARNLANFPFPECFRGDDDYRVQSLIFDSFSQLQTNSNEENMKFHAVETRSLDVEGRKILEERGVLKIFQTRGGQQFLPETGVVMSMDGRNSTTINCIDHIRIASFQSGLACRQCFEECNRIDTGLQQTLQFAASYDFGFLTASFADTGSGMKISARIHIPATVRCGQLGQITEIAKKNGCHIIPAFSEISQGSAAGSFFLMETKFAMAGSEVDQIASFEAACQLIAETERKILAEFADNKKTVIKNSVIRAYSIARFSLLVSLREAIDIISDISLGLKLNMLSGIENSMLCGLLYRVQPAHLSYLIESGNFSFEEDIKNDKRSKIDRIRALILQEAFEKISLGKL